MIVSEMAKSRENYAKGEHASELSHTFCYFEARFRTPDVGNSGRIFTPVPGVAARECYSKQGKSSSRTAGLLKVPTVRSTSKEVQLCPHLKTESTPVGNLPGR